MLCFLLVTPKHPLDYEVGSYFYCNLTKSPNQKNQNTWKIHYNQHVSKL